MQPSLFDAIVYGVFICMFVIPTGNALSEFYSSSFHMMLPCTIKPTPLLLERLGFKLSTQKQISLDMLFNIMHFIVIPRGPKYAAIFVRRHCIWRVWCTNSFDCFSSNCQISKFTVVIRNHDVVLCTRYSRTNSTRFENMSRLCFVLNKQWLFLENSKQIMAKVKFPPRSSTAPPRIQLRRKILIYN
jgi:hypothetical protein